MLRVQNRTEEALSIQLRLEAESDAARDPRAYILEELELLSFQRVLGTCRVLRKPQEIALRMSDFDAIRTAGSSQ